MESKATSDVKVLKAHLALNVTDVERSMAFYRKLFNIEPSKVRRGYAKFDVQVPPLNLTLNENSFAGQGALSHLGIQVSSTEDVLAMRERWRAAGLETADEMRTNCCYAVQDKTWVKDPDGYEWEAFVVLEDDLAESTTCCVPDAADRSSEREASACSTGAVAFESSPEIVQPAGDERAGAAASCCEPAAGAASCCEPSTVGISR